MRHSFNLCEIPCVSGIQPIRRGFFCLFLLYQQILGTRFPRGMSTTRRPPMAVRRAT